MTTPDEKTLATLTKLFEEEFGPIGDRQVLYVHAPGRSEISGNHTDHEGGHVIAGSLDVAVDGIAVATDSNKIRVADEGYPTFEITLDTVDIQVSEKGTSASLVRGMAENGATAGKTDLAKRAKAAGLDAIHDTVHEMARDEARHGKAFAGLLKRYFG